MASFGQWLSEEMRRRRIWSVNRIAREAGLDPLKVSDWLFDRSRPGPTEAKRLARYLKVPGIPVDDLGRFTDGAGGAIGKTGKSARSV